MKTIPSLVVLLLLINSVINYKADSNGVIIFNIRWKYIVQSKTGFAI